MDGYQFNGFLHELMDIFVSLIIQYVPESFPLRDYFICILVCIITVLVVSGSFCLLFVVVSETFKCIRGSRS